ncbi:MAG: hypothetical protein SWO11_00360 [Thermodesulfobacteriota bacterium]|nr:hypothetical protein [Thermodesulfobacteriota bacterium]
MGRLKITGKLGCLIAFADFFLLSCGLHLIHPLFFEHHHCHVKPVDNPTHTGFSVSLIEGSYECLLCTFFADFHISCPRQPILRKALDSPFKYPAQGQLETLKKILILRPKNRAPPSSTLFEYSV